MVLAAKRSRQLNRGAAPRVDSRHKKPTSGALEEIAAAKESVPRQGRRRRAEGMSLDGRELILGITGSIAAYRRCTCCASWGASARVQSLRAPREFVGPLTFRTLSGRPVLSNLFDPQSADAVEHVALAERCDAVVVAPATANLLAKAAHGIADDFRQRLTLAAPGRCSWSRRWTAAWRTSMTVAGNLHTLRSRGVTVLEPAWRPRLGSRRQGRFPEVDDIVEALRRVLYAPGPHQRRVLVTASPTRADRSRQYISNRSSGKMGYGLAAAAAAAEAAVRWSPSPTALTPPPGPSSCRCRRPRRCARRCCITSSRRRSSSRRRRSPTIAPSRPRPPRSKPARPRSRAHAEPRYPGGGRRAASGTFVVGFAAETHDVAANARAKLESKGIDLLVANDVSQTGISFDAEDNEVLLLDR